jgi:hypothetical protein
MSARDGGSRGIAAAKTPLRFRRADTAWGNDTEADRKAKVARWRSFP